MQNKQVGGLPIFCVAVLIFKRKTTRVVFTFFMRYVEQRYL